MWPKSLISTVLFSSSFIYVTLRVGLHIKKFFLTVNITFVYLQNEEEKEAKKSEEML
jgi:hypothetical protein